MMYIEAHVEGEKERAEFEGVVWRHLLNVYELTDLVQITARHIRPHLTLKQLN